jgi:hypothetical protein
MTLRCTSLFSQLLQIFPRQEFQRAVRQHGAEYNAKGFASWDQFVAMLFCHLAQADSLRDICGGLRSCLGKVVHLGMADAPSRSTLAYANAHRPWQLYATVLDQLVARCHTLTGGRTKFRFRNKLYSMDSTLIELSLAVFDWARYRFTKGAAKLHLVLDHEGYLPVFADLTAGHVHDINVARGLQFPPGSILAVDRGYYAYDLFGQWTSDDIFFVTRMKKKTKYRVVERRDPPRGILCDQIIELTTPKARRLCPHRLRRIAYRDPDTGKRLVFLTNHLDFGATTIARIYKDRWQIEIFFKELKNTLKIKSFVGTSVNALMTQIWTALIALVLLKYLKLRSRFGWALSNLVAFLRWNLFTYRDLWEWLDDPFHTPPLGPQPEQLVLALPGLGQHKGGPGP